MPMHVRSARTIGVLLVAAVVAACGGPSFRDADDRAEPRPPETAEVGSGVDRPGRDLGDLATTTTLAAPVTSASPGRTTASSSATVAPAAVETGRAEIVVRDPRGPGRSGVTVLMEGPVTQRLRSGAGGRIEVTAPPGRYRLTVETGCIDDLHITRGATGELGLALGDLARGELTVAASLRYRPENGAYWREGEARGSGRADWRRGRCTSSRSPSPIRATGRARLSEPQVTRSAVSASMRGKDSRSWARRRRRSVPTEASRCGCVASDLTPTSPSIWSTPRFRPTE